jgi:hypothetical protein
MSERRRLLLLAVLPPAAIALAAVLMDAIGMRGGDWGAHAYRLQLLRQGAPIMWDPFWYCGTYGAANYGILYYLAAERVGTLPILIVSAGSLPLLFHLYIRRQWAVASLAPPLALAALLVAYLAYGQDPFLLSLALVMGGLALFAYGRPVLAALPIAAAAFTNPVGLVCGAVFVTADAIARPRVRRDLVVLVAVLAPFLALRAALFVIFAEKAVYMSQVPQHLKVIGVAVVGMVLAWYSRDPDRRGRVTLFAVAAALSIVAMLPVLAPLGNNADRFLYVFAVPLLLCIRDCRVFGLKPVVPVAAACLLALYLQLYTPYKDVVRTGDYAASRRSYFTPALQYATRVHDQDFRVHVLDLKQHAEAYYFPLDGLPITRGWLRQADALHNAILYRPYDSRGYVAWLRELGVEYVFVPDGRLDVSSEREPAAIAGSRELAKVWSGGHWTAYRVLDPWPLVVPATPDGAPSVGSGRRPGAPSTAALSAGARVTAYGRAEIDLQVDRPGLYLVRITWSRFWSTDEGALQKAPGDWVLLRADRTGITRLRYSATGLASTVAGLL